MEDFLAEDSSPKRGFAHRSTEHEQVERRVDRSSELAFEAADGFAAGMPSKKRQRPISTSAVET
jgi:hypothetical protein